VLFGHCCAYLEVKENKERIIIRFGMAKIKIMDMEMR